MSIFFLSSLVYFPNNINLYLYVDFLFIFH